MSPSSERDWRLYADDIVEACGKIRRFIAGMDYDTFAADERTRDAVVRNLEVIGEAAKHLPDEVTRKAPQIPWRLICGMRDVLAHAYFVLSVKVVWDTATTQIEQLETAVRALAK
jgi:uncharacterized protein with HEPN domain